MKSVADPQSSNLLIKRSPSPGHHRRARGGRNKFAFEGEHVRASHSKSRSKSYGPISSIKTSAASTLASPLAVRMPISPSFCSRWRFFFAPFY